jgi:hypothetical protein
VAQPSHAGRASVSATVSNNHKHCSISVTAADAADPAILAASAVDFSCAVSSPAGGAPCERLSPPSAANPGFALFAAVLPPQSTATLSYEATPRVRNVNRVQPNINNGEDLGELVAAGRYLGRCEPPPEGFGGDVPPAREEGDVGDLAAGFLARDPWPDVLLAPAEAFWMSSNSALVNVPFADGSMPCVVSDAAGGDNERLASNPSPPPPRPPAARSFNVITLTSTFVAFVLGTVLNLLVRKSGESVSEARYPGRKKKSKTLFEKLLRR